MSAVPPILEYTGRSTEPRSFPTGVAIAAICWAHYIPWLVLTRRRFGIGSTSLTYAQRETFRFIWQFGSSITFACLGIALLVFAAMTRRRLSPALWCLAGAFFWTGVALALRAIAKAMWSGFSPG